MSLLKLLLVSEIIDGDYGGGSGDTRRHGPLDGVQQSPPRPDPPRPDPAQPVNLFHDVFREDPPPVFYQPSFFEKFNLLLKIALIISIIVGCLMLDGTPISLIRYENVTITDKETGDKFVKYIMENDKLVEIDAINVKTGTVYVKADSLPKTDNLTR